MESLFDRVKTFCQAEDTAPTFWIAYSGGLDSHVLLHACAELRHHHAIIFKAIHVNHGLSSNARVWAEHCKATCDALQIDLIINNITILSKSGDSPEALARDLRYQAFIEQLGENDVLLTAH
jgi:tRNA(Ile)-lysidine synthase